MERKKARGTAPAAAQARDPRRRGRAAGVRARTDQQGPHGADDARHVEQRGPRLTDLQTAQRGDRRRPQGPGTQGLTIIKAQKEGA